MRTISCAISRMMPGRPGRATLAEVPLLRNQAPMPPHQRIRSDERVQLEQRFASDRLGFSRQQRSFGVAKSNTLSAQPLLEQLILCLEEFDDDELVTIDPAGRDHEQK